jgi:hypothetical protein
MKENTNRVSDFPFIRFPAALVKLPCFKSLSADAKLLYALIVDRFNLSIANKWKDENGTPYVYFSIDSVMESIGCAKAKAVKLMDTLEDWGLIRRAKQGLGKPNRIYVLDPALLDQFENRTTLSTSSSTDQFDSDTSSEIKPVGNQTTLSTDQFDNQTSSDQFDFETSSIIKPKKFDFQTPEVWKSNPNQTKYNQIKSNQTEREEKETKVPALVSGVMNQTAKEILCRSFDEALVKRTTSLLYELVATPSQHVRVDNTLTSGYALSQHLANISVEQIQSALNNFTARTCPAAEERDYLLTALYDAAKNNRTA